MKPSSLDKARAEAVAAEIDGLAQEDRAVTKENLQQELKVLRNAIKAWTAYELVKAEVTVPLSELTLENETLKAKLQEKKAQLAQQVTEDEAKEAEYQERMMEMLHHVVDARHNYAKAQSSNVEKEKALRAAESVAGSLAQRIPREDISGEWWGKFNTTYKAIRQDLQQFVKEGETLDPTQEIPLPQQVVANLTWLERPVKRRGGNGRAGQWKNGWQRHGSRRGARTRQYDLGDLRIALRTRSHGGHGVSDDGIAKEKEASARRFWCRPLRRWERQDHISGRRFRRTRPTADQPTSPGEETRRSHSTTPAFSRRDQRRCSPQSRPEETSSRSRRRSPETPAQTATAGITRRVWGVSPMRFE